MSIFNPKPDGSYLRDSRGNQRPRWSLSVTYEQARSAMAHHEAAHAVVSMVLGFRVSSCTVQGWEEGSGWAVTGDTRVFLPRGADLDLYTVQLASGSLAQKKAYREAGLWSAEVDRGTDAPHDRTNALDLLREAGATDRDAGIVWAAAEGMASSKVDRHWGQIVDVARVVGRESSITGKRVSRISRIPLPR